VSCALQAKFLSPAMSQRLRSVCVIPLTALSEFAIFTFFSNTSIGYLIFHRLIVTSKPNVFIRDNYDFVINQSHLCMVNFEIRDFRFVFIGNAATTYNLHT